MAAKKKVAKKSAQEKGKPEAKEPREVKPKAPVHTATAVVEVEEQGSGKPKDEAKGKNGFLNRKAKKGPEPKKEKPSVDLEPLKKKVVEAEAELTKARNEADALRMQAKGVEEAAKKAYAEVLAPYREACRKAGAKCEFSGGKASPLTPRVRFLVERTDGGIKVAIKGRSETEEVIPDKVMKESVGKAADVYVEKWVGTREEIGNKAAGLGQRFRNILAKK